MKKISITLFAALLFIAATFKASAQTEETRHVSGFTGIATGGSFEVHVKIDGTESLKLVADASAIKDIETVVEDGKLQIRFKKSREWGHENYGKIEVYVTAKSLSSLSIGGAGSMKVEGALTGNDVKLTIGGAGNIISTVKASKLYVTIGGSGTVKIDGNAEEAKISIGGSGNITAKDLKIGTASISIGGSGRATIDVEKSISASIAGSGHVTYSGNATVSSFSAAGSGSISKAND